MPRWAGEQRSNSTNAQKQLNGNPCLKIRTKNGKLPEPKNSGDSPSGLAANTAFGTLSFSVISVGSVKFLACACLRREAALSYQDKHTPRLQIGYKGI